MISYIETYYVPSAGYRADPETEAALEAQRERSIMQIKSALEEWEKRKRP
jgi:hypothetical protein